jgi:hypothetical protein
MTVIPLTNDGARTMTCETPAGQLTFYTYWQPLLSTWLMDLSDGAGNPLLTGMALVGGTPNLLAGTGLSQFDGYNLSVVEGNGGNSRSIDSWGNTAVLCLFNPGETPFLVMSDPMLADVPLTEEVA